MAKTTGTDAAATLSAPLKTSEAPANSTATFRSISSAASAGS